MDAPFDPRPAFVAAVEQSRSVIAAVGPDDLTRPTPCTEYDVQQLLGHLIGVAGRIDHVGRGGFFADAPAMVEDIDPAAVPAEFRTRTASAIDAWSDDERLTATYQAPWGASPGFGMVAAYTQELVVHSWDLASAIGFDDLDPELAVGCLATAKQFVPAEIRTGEGVPFGPVVEVGDDADPYLQLAGWLGRHPLVDAA